VKAVYFAAPAEFGKWLGKSHAAETEILVGFYKRDSGKPSMTWPQSVDEALCFGWIDGVRRRVDELRYTIRFTPRKTGSIWSAVNIRRVEELSRAGRMRRPGRKAFEARSETRSRVYSYEQKHEGLSEPYAGVLRKNGAAWKFFESRGTWYRKKASWWVMSAKRDETRTARLAKLIAASARGVEL
jgi:uncharacterized protein YdeI (YjbR/CyaY-like superfamily)